MILRAFVQRFTKSAELMSILVAVLCVMALANVLLTLKVFTSSQTIVQIPPGLEQDGTLTPGTASESVLAAWGLSVANLVGNATPRTVPFVVETLQGFMAPSSYQAITTDLAAQARHLELENLSLNFSASSVQVDVPKKKVIVAGILTTHGLRNQRRTEVRTYEMTFRVTNYIVQLASLTSYEGQPKKENAS